ncbi:hypothetical protein C2G38_2235252 [Gigaspora rosea]|uniref:Uncharacterized protein n=1 Tax=Gigaspora rosea TaxID=44941 RepID=A0A397TQK1_9GLOM|nr:hypothetical protein C2G38_2235252 [Gigaspora rosea]
MSSLFTAFCFTKNVTGNDKCISGTTLYRINHNVDKFREITFKGFTASSEFMVTLVQSVSISSSEEDYVLTPEDLSSLSPLLIYSAGIVADSYIPDNQGGRESFMMCYEK